MYCTGIRVENRSRATRGETGLTQSYRRDEESQRGTGFHLDATTQQSSTKQAAHYCEEESAEAFCTPKNSELDSLGHVRREHDKGDDCIKARQPKCVRRLQGLRRQC